LEGMDELGGRVLGRSYMCFDNYVVPQINLPF
jgi:hypothetical protein